jgi:hypothetical protein
MSTSNGLSASLFQAGAVLALVLAAGSAQAEVFQSATWFNVNSYKRLGVAGNQDRSIDHNGGVCQYISIGGTLRQVTPGTFPREASIRAQRFIRLAPNLNILTHEMIIQPFTGTAFGANGTVEIPRGSLVIPVPQTVSLTASPSSVLHGEPGFWEFTFFEQVDDNSTDSGTTPDARWDDFTVSFNDTPVNYDTAEPVSGTVATTTRYNVRSDDDLGAGQFTGTIVSNLNRPATGGNNRIRHVRLSGWLTGRTYSTLAETVGSNPTGQARVRITRTESVLLSPNDLSPFTKLDEKFFTLPAATPSSDRVLIDLPIAESDDFGSLVREVQQGGPNESYFGFSYFLNAYESDDDWPTADNVWNGLKVEFFTDGQPPTQNVVNLGVLSADPAGSEEVLTRTATMPAGAPLWFRFTLPTAVSNAANTYLDIDLEGTNPTFDTVLGLYPAFGADAGDRVALDDDQGGQTRSAFSFGDTTLRPVDPSWGDYEPRNGRDGALAAGTYYVAVSTWVQASGGTDVLGVDHFRVTNPALVNQSVTANFRFNFPLACGPSDIAGAGPVPGADGELTADDVILFIAAFTAQNLTVADIAGAGPVPGADGELTADDIILFIARFTAGC